MSRKSTLFMLTVLAVTLVCGYFIHSTLHLPTIPPNISMVRSILDAASPHTVLVTFDNSFLSFKEDPLLSSITSACGASLHQLFHIKLIIFTIGLGLFLSCLGSSITIAPLVTLGLVSFLGESTVVFGQLLWLPWLGWILTTPLFSRTITTIGILFFSLRIVQSAGEMSLLLCSFIWLISFQHLRHKNFLTILFVFLPAISVLLLAESPHLPTYPTDARLVPDDHLPEALLPFFSPSLSTTSINRVLIKESLRGLVLGITLLSAFFALFERSRLMTITTIIAALIFFDLIPSEGTAQLFPLANFSRFYPTLYLYSVIPLAIGFFLIAASTTRHAILICGTISVALCIGAHRNHHPFYCLGEDRLLEFNHAWKIGALRKTIVSPSFYSLYHHHFNLPLVEGRDYNKLRLWNIPHELRSSKEEGDLRFVADDDGSTRWSPKVGSQDGSQWILLKFTRRIPQLVGMYIDSGVFFSDFARGIKISAASRCSTKNDGTFVELTSFPRWEGSLATTRRVGLPYFEPRYRAKLYFKEPFSAECYLIESIGHNREYDWSIASLIPLEQPSSHPDN